MGRVWLGTAQDGHLPATGEPDDPPGTADATVVTRLSRPPIRRPAQRHHRRAARREAPRARWPWWRGRA